MNTNENVIYKNQLNLNTFYQYHCFKSNLICCLFLYIAFITCIGNFDYIFFKTLKKGFSENAASSCMVEVCTDRQTQKMEELVILSKKSVEYCKVSL